MRKVREVLRLRFKCGRTQRQISASCGMSTGAVSDYLARAAKAGLTWEVASTLSDTEVEGRLFGHVGRNEPGKRTPVAFAGRKLIQVAARKLIHPAV